jgi:FkbM family methyltransferase
MAELAREVAVLAFVDELQRWPQMLEDWGSVVGADDPVTLVIHPGTWDPGQVAQAEPQLRERLARASTSGAPHAFVLTGPAFDLDENRLAQRCVGVYGAAGLPERLSRLTRIDLAAIRRLANEAIEKRPQRHLQSRLFEGRRVYYRLTPADLGVMGQIFELEEYSLTRLSAWPGIAVRGISAEGGRRPLIVDCGANIGASSVYFALRFPDAEIVAIEPEADNFDVLLRNTEGLRVVPLQTAVMDEAGSVVLTDPGTGAWGFRTGEAREGERVVGEVEAITVADAIEAGAGAVPFLLKVDIEGAEEQLFSSHHEQLNSFPVVVVELHDWMFPGRETSRRFLDWHRSFDRDLVTLGENVFSISTDLRS